MFNLFNKSKQTEVKNNYPEIVKEIHNEFFTAGDKILEEANKILLEAPTKSIEKGKRLASLGFSNTPEAINAKSIEGKLLMSKELAEITKYYQFNYPNNKFITEEAVANICKKYSLVCGEISMYTGFVPELKLKQIEKFKVNKTDLPERALIGSKHRTDGFDETQTSVLLEYINSNQLSGYAENNSAYILASKDPNYSYVKDKNMVDKYLGKWGYIEAIFVGATLKICAPLKDMKIPDNKMVLGHKIVNIPDPVVLQPVRGGYLIVCAWGDEANDELVVNEKMN